VKKYNSKQIAYSEVKVRKAKERIMKIFLLLVTVLIFGTMTIVSAVDKGFDTADGVIGGGSVIAMSMSLIGNISQPSDRDTAPTQLGFKLWLVARDQIDTTVAFPLPDASREVASITLLSGEYFHCFEGVENSLKYIATGEKGDITSTYNKDVPLVVKLDDAGLDFIEQYQGNGFILFFQECEDTEIKILGSYCKAMILKSFEVKEDGDGKYISLMFGNTYWRQLLKYSGTIVTQTPSVVVADATNIPIVANPQYRLTDGTGAAVIATVSGIGSADYGRVIDILAGVADTNAPTIADNTVFVLIDGTTWTANVGSKISFKILDDATLIEVAGSRVQTA